MKLHSPFEISARLAPAIRIADKNGTAWLSFDNGFVLDLPDGTEHRIKDFRWAPGSNLQEAFGSILSFLGACAESRSYAERMRKDPMSGDNSDLFPDNVGAWAQQYSDEISMLQLEIEETDSELIEA